MHISTLAVALLAAGPALAQTPEAAGKEVHKCFTQKAFQVRTIDIDDAVADLVIACGPAGKTFLELYCAADDSQCRMMAAAAIFESARQAILASRKHRK